ncbi:MAG: AraC family transcriptional regulator [Acetatifactor sp.]|nr:AraC family transcriptional regulator [Acetatifactor sp.]
MAKRLTYEEDRITDGLDIFFWIFNRKSGFVATHWHRAIEINYVIDGEVNVYVNGENHSLHTGDLFLVDSYVPHSVTSPYGNRAILIQIPYSLLKKYIPDFENLSFSIYTKTSNPIEQTKIMQFIETIKKMEILFEIRPKGGNLRFNSLVFELLYQLYHNFSSPLSESDLRKKQKNFERISLIMDYTNEHFMNPISLDEISSVACLQKEYFCHFFKNQMGLTYLDYLNELRLSHIKEDLSSTDMPVKDILEKNGFTNYKLFRRLFYNKLKTTPTQYRKNLSN